MNLKLQYVLSDITGATGMRIIRAIVAGERDRNRLAAMRDVRTKADEATIAKALDGDYRVEHWSSCREPSWCSVLRQIHRGIDSRLEIQIELRMELAILDQDPHRTCLRETVF